MTRRLRIASNDASPFRVSASGVDVNGATFDGLLFDGNQMPLRVYASGYMLATPIAGGALDVAIATAGPFGPSVSGHSLFTLVYRHQTTPNPAASHPRLAGRLRRRDERVEQAVCA